jgi:hypothetical protein
MARILNLEAYPLATTISDQSFLIGTDASSNNQTKNFKIEDLKTHILPNPLTQGTFENATVVVGSDGQISSVTQGASGSSKWSFSLNTNDIYRNSNVGIGDFSASDPAEALEVQGKIQVSGADAEFIGDIRGAVLQKVKVKEPGGVDKGDVVYISGGTGDNPEVQKARANTPLKMPALGIMKETAAFDADSECIVSGELTGLNLTGFSTGDEVFVSSTVVGGLVSTAPTGEANLIQKIGKVIKGGNGGAITILGAFRTNATPNLNQGSLFIGDASNQSSTLAIGGANTFLKSDGTTASWSSISSSDLPTNLALVASSSNGFVPRFNATINTIESGTIRDDGTTVSISSNTANIPDSTTDLSVTAGLDKRAIKVSQVWGPNEAAKITVSRTDLGTSPTTAPVTGLFIDATSGKDAAGDFKHIKLDTELSITPSVTPKTINNVFGIQLSDYSAVSSVTANNLYQIYLGDIDALTKGSGEFYGIYQKEASIKNYLAGQLQLGHTAGTAGQFLKSADTAGNAEWSAISNSDVTGAVQISGTPVNNQIAVWTNSDTIEGTDLLTYNGGTTALKVSSPSDDDYSEMTNNGITQVRSGNDANLDLICYGDQSKGSEIQSKKFRNEFGNPQALLNGDLIASHRILGATDALGTSSTCMLIETRAAENFSGTNQGVRYSIDTNALGESGDPTERFAIESDGSTNITGGLAVTSTLQRGIDLTHNPSGSGTAIGNDIDLTGNANTTTAYGFYSKVDTSLGGSAYGGWFRVLGSDGAAFGSYGSVEGSVGGASYGAYNVVGIGGTDTSGGTMYGSQNIITISTSGTHGASMIGSSVDLNYNKVNGSLTNAFGFYSTGIVCNDSGATIANAYGIYLGDNAGDGTITDSWGVYQAGADDKNYFAGSIESDSQIYSSIQPTTVAATSSTIDWNDGNVAVLELGGSTSDVTLTLTNPKAGASYLIKIVQGSSLVDVIFPTTVKFADNSTQPYVLDVTATNNAIDVVALTCISDSGTVEYLANVSQNYG